MGNRLTAWLRRSLERIGILSGKRADRPLRSTEDYDRVYEELSREELHASHSDLSAEQLFVDLTDREHRSQRFMGLYSNEGGLLALRRYGFLKLLEDKGFDPIMHTDTTDPARQKLCLYDGSAVDENLLVELVVGFRDLELPDGERCRMLFIDWLLMQNPRKTFSDDAPRLPEQRHPGLGLFIPFGHILRLMATRLDCDGLLNHPAHYHNAFLYAKFMHFVDPEDEGRFRALRRDLADMDLAEASAAVDNGKVLDQHGQVVSWRGTDQVMPISLRVSGYFESESYRETVERTYDSLRFEVQAG